MTVAKKLEEIYGLNEIYLSSGQLLKVLSESGDLLLDIRDAPIALNAYGSGFIAGSASIGGSAVVGGAGVIAGALQANGLNYPAGPGVAGDRLIVSSPGNVGFETPKFKDVARVEGPITAVGDTAYLDAINVNFNLPNTGDYKYTVSYIWNHNATNSDFLGRLIIDGVEQFLHKQEPKDAAGGDPTGSTQRYGFTKVDSTNIINGSRNFQVQVATDNASHASTMFKVFLEVEEL